MRKRWCVPKPNTHVKSFHPEPHEACLHFKSSQKYYIYQGILHHLVSIYSDIYCFELVEDQMYVFSLFPGYKYLHRNNTQAVFITLGGKMTNVAVLAHVNCLTSTA